MRRSAATSRAGEKQRRRWSRKENGRKQNGAIGTMGKSDRKKRTPARGVLFGSTRKSDLFCSQIIVDLVFQNLSVQAVNHSCFFQGLTLCRRAADAVHTGSQYRDCTRSSKQSSGTHRSIWILSILKPGRLHAKES